MPDQGSAWYMPEWVMMPSDPASCFVCRKHRDRGSLMPGGPVAEDDLVVVSHIVTPDVGIGKTTVWEAGCSYARDHGFLVLSARASEAETRRLAVIDSRFPE